MKSRRTPHDWRRAVLRNPSITDATRVLLLVMAEHMRSNNLHVSVPRKDLARWLNRSERRIQERVQRAHEAGLLDTVVRGQKGVTAVYAGLFPEALSRTISSTLNIPKTVTLRAGSVGHTGVPPVLRETTVYGVTGSGGSNIVKADVDDVRNEERTKEKRA